MWGRISLTCSDVVGIVPFICTVLYDIFRFVCVSPRKPRLHVGRVVCAYVYGLMCVCVIAAIASLAGPHFLAEHHENVVYVSGVPAPTTRPNDL